MMEINQAEQTIKGTFAATFDAGKYSLLLRNMLDLDISGAFTRTGFNIPKAFNEHIKKYSRIGKYIDPNGKVLDVLVVNLRRKESLDQARTMQRNFVAWYLSSHEKDAALVAFQADQCSEWRFSFIRMTYHLEKQEKGIKIKKELTEARRYSFLVGKNEPSHTAQQHLAPFLTSSDKKPAIETIEQAFSIDRVTDRFFEEYKSLFEKLKDELEKISAKDLKIKQEFEDKEIDISAFSKKLLGQLVFLYFVQKKGWLGVEKDGNGNHLDWGTGPKNFLQNLYDKKEKNKNFFNDILEPLFYSTLATDRRHQDDWCEFDCRIPFLNGGLFEPIKNYDWKKTDVRIKDSIFGDIFAVFDRYNFTVKEDEPLEKEVAVDPEMLGKVFEKLLDSADQKNKGAFYTPRVIVHYMCQQSLIQYLSVKLGDLVQQQDVIKLVNMGDSVIEVNQAMQEGYLKEDNKHYQEFRLPKTIIKFAAKIDELLETITICDPAIGSGAFPVGMMKEIVRIRQVLTAFIKNKEKRTAYDFKRHAIEKCLYGVDIDASAVDIAKLRLWLSLIVDEENVREINPLPNLDYKIMQGDSLLENYKGITLYDEERIMQSDFSITNNIVNLEKCIEESAEAYIKTCKQGGFNKKIQQKFEKEIDIYKKEIKKLKALVDSKENLAIPGKTLFDGQLSESQIKKQKLHDLRQELFNETNKIKKKQLKREIENHIWEFINITLKEQKQIVLLSEVEQYRNSNQRPFMLWRLHFDDVFGRENSGFDVVIGNPPYVSNKMVDKEFQDYYKQVYGMSDDLYNYFFIKAFDICRDGGIVTYISSDTYFTLQSKHNLRVLFQHNRIVELIKTENVFQNAMVSPAIITMRKEDCRNEDYSLIVKDAVDDFEKPQSYIIKIKIFRNIVNQVFFVPTPLNMQIYNKYNKCIEQLHHKWWGMISSSTKIAENEIELGRYRKSLQPGDVTLLGLVTEGGKGLDTSNNGRFIGVIEGSKSAQRIYETRPRKLYDAIKKYKMREFKDVTSINEARDFIVSLKEKEIWKLFDKLKEKYDRDIFGQGYLFRILTFDEIADVDALSLDEKEKGIKVTKPHFVPYDKGDKDGNRWYLETPFYIDWSQESVKWLKSNSGKKGRGMPTIRNPQFYFKDGFCWSDIHTVLIKARLKKKGVYDVKSMSLFSLFDITPDWYLVCLLNSKFLSEYSFEYVNNTQTLQINDGRQLPIVIPNQKQLAEFKNLFDRAYEIKRKQFEQKLSDEIANQKLDAIQSELDKMVYRLYGIETEIHNAILSNLV